MGRRPAVADALGPAFVLMPGSFSGDEPVANVLAAARRLAQWTFVLTGDLTIARRKHDLSNLSPNVIFTGFLPTAEFEWLLVRASVVIALTVNSDVELSAGNEALGFGKPLVVSDSPVSRQLFGDCAVYADPQSVDSLTDAIGAALQRESLQLRIEAHRAARLAASRKEIAAVLG